MRRLLRWLARLAVGLVCVVALALGIVYWRSNAILAQRIDVNEAALGIPSDADAIARGQHIAITHGCTDCHATDLGGKVLVDAFPIGRIVGPNITRGKNGIGAQLDPKRAELAIRHGLAADGRPLLFMPSRDFSSLSDADTSDLIAYLVQVPPVDRQVPPPLAGPLARVLFMLDKLPLAEALIIDQHAAHRARIEAVATAEYGAYLATSCSGCHGQHFSGGHVPGTPPSFPAARNITPDPASGIGKWSKVDFYTALRQGKRPDGSAIDPFMPWQAFGQMTDTELDALWAFLRTQPPRASGGG